jgi:hypothetical protein
VAGFACLGRGALVWLGCYYLAALLMLCCGWFSGWGFVPCFVGGVVGEVRLEGLVLSSGGRKGWREVGHARLLGTRGVCVL